MASLSALLALSACGKAPISGSYTGNETVEVANTTMTTGSAQAGTNSTTTSASRKVYITVEETGDGQIKGTWVSGAGASFTFTGKAVEDRIENVVLTYDNANAQSAAAAGGTGYGSYGYGSYGYGYNALVSCAYKGILFLDKDTLRGQLNVQGQQAYPQQYQYCPEPSRALEAKRASSG